MPPGPPLFPSGHSPEGMREQLYPHPARGARASPLLTPPATQIGAGRSTAPCATTTNSTRRRRRRAALSPPRWKQKRTRRMCSALTAGANSTRRRGRGTSPSARRSRRGVGFRCLLWHAHKVPESVPTDSCGAETLMGFPRVTCPLPQAKPTRLVKGSGHAGGAI